MAQNLVKKAFKALLAISLLILMHNAISWGISSCGVWWHARLQSIWCLMACSAWLDCSVDMPRWQLSTSCTDTIICSGWLQLIVHARLSTWTAHQSTHCCSWCEAGHCTADACALPAGPAVEEHRHHARPHLLNYVPDSDNLQPWSRLDSEHVLCWLSLICKHAILCAQSHCWIHALLLTKILAMASSSAPLSCVGHRAGALPRQNWSKRLEQLVWEDENRTAH